MITVGTLPEDLGPVDIENTESHLSLYLPVKLPGQAKVSLPENLRKYAPILAAVWADLLNPKWRDSYVYLTVKAMHVTGGCTGQRPGWHSDGFLTNDINYVWYDREATEFYDGPLMHVPENHQDSLKAFKKCSLWKPKTYPNKHVLRLDHHVIHRPKDLMKAGMRTFVKVSVSKHVYALEGNSVNYDRKILNTTEKWDYSPRQKARNCPVTD